MITTIEPGQIAISADGHKIAHVCADWEEQEACIVILAPGADRQQVESQVAQFWPTLEIIWPEDLTVIEVTL